MSTIISGKDFSFVSGLKEPQWDQSHPNYRRFRHIAAELRRINGFRRPTIKYSVEIGNNKDVIAIHIEDGKRKGTFTVENGDIIYKEDGKTLVYSKKNSQITVGDKKIKLEEGYPIRIQRQVGIDMDTKDLFDDQRNCYINSDDSQDVIPVRIVEMGLDKFVENCNITDKILKRLAFHQFRDRYHKDPKLIWDRIRASGYNFKRMDFYEDSNGDDLILVEYDNYILVIDKYLYCHEMSKKEFASFFELSEAEEMFEKEYGQSWNHNRDFFNIHQQRLQRYCDLFTSALDACTEYGTSKKCSLIKLKEYENRNFVAFLKVKNGDKTERDAYLIFDIAGYKLLYRSNDYQFEYDYKTNIITVKRGNEAVSFTFENIDEKGFDGYVTFDGHRIKLDRFFEFEQIIRQLAKEKLDDVINWLNKKRLLAEKKDIINIYPEGLQHKFNRLAFSTKVKADGICFEDERIIVNYKRASYTSGKFIFSNDGTITYHDRDTIKNYRIDATDNNGLITYRYGVTPNEVLVLTVDEKRNAFVHREILKEGKTVEISEKVPVPRDVRFRSFSDEIEERLLGGELKEILDTVKTDKKLQNMKPYYEEFPIDNGIINFVITNLTEEQRKSFNERKELANFAYQKLYRDDYSREMTHVFDYLYLHLARFVALSDESLKERDEKIIDNLTEKERDSGNHVGYFLIEIPALYYAEGLDEAVSTLINYHKKEPHKATSAERAIVEAYKNAAEREERPNESIKIKDLVDLCYNMAFYGTKEQDCSKIIETIITSDLDITWIIKRYSYRITPDVLEIISIYVSNPDMEREIHTIINSGNKSDKTLRKIRNAHPELFTTNAE